MEAPCPVYCERSHCLFLFQRNVVRDHPPITILPRANMRGDSLTRMFAQRHSRPLLLLFESVRFDNWFAHKNRVLLINVSFAEGDPASNPRGTSHHRLKEQPSNGLD